MVICVGKAQEQSPSLNGEDGLKVVDRQVIIIWTQANFWGIEGTECERK